MQAQFGFMQAQTAQRNAAANGGPEQSERAEKRGHRSRRRPMATNAGDLQAALSTKARKRRGCKLLRTVAATNARSHKKS